jgi:hypothetical protein
MPHSTASEAPRSRHLQSLSVPVPNPLSMTQSPGPAHSQAFGLPHIGIQNAHHALPAQRLHHTCNVFAIALYRTGDCNHENLTGDIYSSGLLMRA